jgi:hypothetical protein
MNIKISQLHIKQSREINLLYKKLHDKNKYEAAASRLE